MFKAQAAVLSADNTWHIAAEKWSPRFPTPEQVLKWCACWLLGCCKSPRAVPRAVRNVSDASVAGHTKAARAKQHRGGNRCIWTWSLFLAFGRNMQIWFVQSFSTKLTWTSYINFWCSWFSESVLGGFSRVVLVRGSVAAPDTKITVTLTCLWKLWRQSPCRI